MTINKKYIDQFILSTERAAYGAALFKGKGNKIIGIANPLKIIIIMLTNVSRDVHLKPVLRLELLVFIYKTYLK